MPKLFSPFNNTSNLNSNTRNINKVFSLLSKSNPSKIIQIYNNNVKIRVFSQQIINPYSQALETMTSSIRIIVNMEIKSQINKTITKNYPMI